MNRFCRSSAVLVIAACLTAALAGERVARPEPVRLRFDPRFVLEVVAQRMQVTLRPEVPLPTIFVESNTPLAQFQNAMQAQWRFRPPLVSNAYAIASNEIYLSDGAPFYHRLKRTLDDSLAHELVHYIQSEYFNEDLSTDACELQAAEIQHWFRAEYALLNRDVGTHETTAGPRVGVL